jgi:hypothetical protein
MFPKTSHLAAHSAQPTVIKKKNKFSSYKEIQNVAVAKSYMINGLLIYGEIFSLFLIY